MTVILEKNTDKKQFTKILDKMNAKKTDNKFNVANFCGVLNLSKDPLVMQKEMRNEWK